MSKDRQEPTLTRRSVLGGIGAATLTSLAGCSAIDNLRNEPEPATESVSSVRLAQLPDDYDGGNDRTAVVSPDLRNTFSLVTRQQIRITRPGQDFDGDFLSALYTVNLSASFLDDTDAKNTIWLSKNGLKRINADAGWRVEVSRIAPDIDLDSAQEAKANDELTEQYIDGSQGNYLFLAPNGGDIEPNTDKQATRAASELSQNSWVTLGYNKGGGARDRWYIPDEYIHPASYPELGYMVSYDPAEDAADEEYDYTYQEAVSFHRFDGDGIVIGGLARDERKNTIRDALTTAFQEQGIDVSVRIANSGKNAATDPSVLVNRVTDNRHNGIRILQSGYVLNQYWMLVANAVIGVYAND